MKHRSHLLLSQDFLLIFLSNATDVRSGPLPVVIVASPHSSYQVIQFGEEKKMGNGSSTPETRKQSQSRKSCDTPTMQRIHEKLEGTAKTETDGMVGCKNRKESKKRKKARQDELKSKQKERSERKLQLSQIWQEHRDQNKERTKKSVFGSKKVEPKHWYDD